MKFKVNRELTEKEIQDAVCEKYPDAVKMDCEKKGSAVRTNKGNVKAGDWSAVRTNEGNAEGGDVSAVSAYIGDAKAGDWSAVRTNKGDAKAGDWSAVRTNEGNAEGGDVSAVSAYIGDAEAGDWSAVRTEEGKATVGKNGVAMGTSIEMGENSVGAILNQEGKIIEVKIKIKGELKTIWEK